MTQLTGCVTAIHRERILVSANGETFGATLKTSVYYNFSSEAFPTVGDNVLVRYNPMGDSQIIKTLPRRSYFSRRDPDPLKGEQAVAANFDYVFMVSSLNADYNEKRLLRYLVLARQSGAEPVVILTKLDLCQDPESYVSSARSVAGPDISIHTLSAVTKEGLKELAPYLQEGKAIVLLGSSGVGKSSLVNAISQEPLMETQAIREDDAKGRHTTTHRQILKLKNGALLIDTPGMRELGMWNADDGLSDAFEDIINLSQGCRFKDCSHQREPYCAVQAAIQNGHLAQTRLDAYFTLEKESAHAQHKAKQLAQKAERTKAQASKLKKSQKAR